MRGTIGREKKQLFTRVKAGTMRAARSREADRAGKGECSEERRFRRGSRERPRRSARGDQSPQGERDDGPARNNQPKCDIGPEYAHRTREAGQEVHDTAPAQQSTAGGCVSRERMPRASLDSGIVYSYIQAGRRAGTCQGRSIGHADGQRV